MINIIVAMSKNGVIGKDNKLPWKQVADLKRFRELTWGKSIIMGRKTHESIGMILPDRHNIIITRDKKFKAPGASVVHTIDQAVCVTKSDEIFVIGGASIYEQFMRRTSKIYLTLIDKNIEGDVSFPEINMNEWYFIGGRPYKADEKNEYDYNFQVYQSKK